MVGPKHPQTWMVVPSQTNPTIPPQEDTLFVGVCSKWYMVLGRSSQRRALFVVRQHAAGADEAGVKHTLLLYPGGNTIPTNPHPHLSGGNTIPNNLTQPAPIWWATTPSLPWVVERSSGHEIFLLMIRTIFESFEPAAVLDWGAILLIQQLPTTGCPFKKRHSELKASQSNQVHDIS